MVNKKNDSIDKTDAEVTSIDELSQLRAIVFGAAEHKLIEQITILKSDMEYSISSLDQSLSTKIAELQQQVDLKFIEIDKRITFIDKAHDDNSASIQKSLDNLYSEHEMFSSATQKDFEDINQSLGNEADNLALNFDKQLKELKTHLDKVSNELSSSKTDRKTLAKLLATMATNLEDDQL
jgi:septal ring factor EnvC (AmiA/AmiB activator)